MLAPRIGMLIPTSAKVGVWLRGGITRVQAVTQFRSDDEFGSSTNEVTFTYVDVTLEPQLVFTPVPHVGITLGAAIDIGATGSAEDDSSSTVEPDFSGSSYGFVAGISAFV